MPSRTIVNSANDENTTKKNVKNVIKKCVHGKKKYSCKECGTPKSKFLVQGGKGICKHGERKYDRKDCCLSSGKEIRKRSKREKFTICTKSYPMLNMKNMMFLIINQK